MTSSKRLIVNSDGFGFGAGATQGILDAIREGGFISSVSVNANFPDVKRVCELAAKFPHVSIGVHLNPMAGKPCLPARQVPSLVGDDGNMKNERFLALLRMGKISLQELEAELDAQIKTVKDLVGSRLTHLDSQANGHLSYFNLFLRLAQRWGIQRMRNNASLICLEAAIPKRSRLGVYVSKPHVWLAHRFRHYQMQKARSVGMRMAHNLITIGYAGTGNKTNVHNWARMMKNLPAGTYEVYCHPAYPDETLRRWSYYSQARGSELTILRNTELRRMAEDAGIEVVSFEAI